MKLTEKGYDIIRKELAGGKITPEQFKGFERVVSALDADKDYSYPQGAYVLATIWHETATRMTPIGEYGKGKGRAYGTWLTNSKGERYCYKDFSKKSVYLERDYPFLYYGRGDTQNTWWDNYDKLSKVFKVDFLRNPDLLLTDEWSTPVTLYSMKVGLYTGRKLSTFVNSNKQDFVEARRVINGVDKADKIAKEALVFLRALRAP